MVDPARRGRGGAAAGRGRGGAAARRGRGGAAAGRGRGGAAAAERDRRRAYLAWLQQLEDTQVANERQAVLAQGGSIRDANRRVQDVVDFWQDVRRFERAINRYEQRGGRDANLLRHHFDADPVLATVLRSERGQAHSTSIIEGEDFFDQLWRDHRNQRLGAVPDRPIYVDDDDDNDALDDNDASTVIDDQEEDDLLDLLNRAAEEGNAVIHMDNRLVRVDPVQRTPFDDVQNPFE